MIKLAGSLSEKDKEKALYEIIGVPYDGNAINKGSREGPKAIRNASQRLETFLWHKKLELSDLLYYDYGDIKLKNPLFKAQNIAEFVLEHTKRRVFLGGDHSVTYPLVKYLFEHGEVASVIAIDAHADFRDSYRGNKYSNACVMRRIAEQVGFEHIIEIGVRSSSVDEYASLNQITIYDADVMLSEKGVQGVLEEIGEGEEKTYLSIDIDVLDPGIAPGVEHPEPCGLSLESLISLVQGIIKGRDVVASDVVEVNPGLDIANGITSLNAARVVFEILACYWERDNRDD
ncbi:MAG TPA: agmatinase [Methanophagales archaeon]|nr:agmatinase [Methanophagales archaeon]